MKKIVCFGETMLRLNPVGYRRLVQARELEVSFAGAEANVAVSLANYGRQAVFVSKVPAHEIGQCAVNDLRRFGVDTSRVLRGGERLGVCYLEKGASQRGSKVIYDRAGSALALADPDEFDWDALLDGADWFHFTGITPALSDGCARMCGQALEAAARKGVRVSCDLNYRNKLWSREKAGEVMGRLLPQVNLCIANEEDAEDLFGIRPEHSQVREGKLDKEEYRSVARQLQQRFGLDQVACTLRTSLSASDNVWSGMLLDEAGECWFAPDYTIHLVDRVGGGDSFGGALIHALLEPMPPQTAISFAVAASCLKQTIEYDYNLASVQEVEALMAGNASGRVQR